MRLAKLFWRLLRYRVAIMLVLFMLIAAALHSALQLHPLRVAIAAIVLAISYVSATSSNDLADEAIDKLNHPASPGRPLINGVASRSDMWLMFSLASSAALLLSLTLGLAAGAIMAASILINVLYSLPPARLSYRTFLAPLVLGLGYVGVPYLLGLAAIHATPQVDDWRWLLGLYLLFVGRIILKDFRDRKGDAKYHKPTFLLRYGKTATCLISLTGLLAGGSIILLQLQQTVWLMLLSALYVACIGVMLYRLFHAAIGKEEQLSIGVGAKMGNGLLITLLCAYALRATGASTAEQTIITTAVSLLFFANYVAFWRNPEQAAIGYRG